MDIKETKFKPFKTFKVQCKTDALKAYNDMIENLAEQVAQTHQSKTKRPLSFLFVLQLCGLKWFVSKNRECLIKKHDWYTVIAKKKHAKGGYLYQLAEPPRSNWRTKKRLWWHSSWFSDPSSGKSRFKVPNEITGKLIEELEQNPEWITESPMVLEEIND